MNICQRCDTQLKTDDEQLNGLCALHLAEENSRIAEFANGGKGKFVERVRRSRPKPVPTEPKAPPSHDVFHENKHVFRMFRVRGNKV